MRLMINVSLAIWAPQWGPAEDPVAPVINVAYLELAIRNPKAVF